MFCLCVGGHWCVLACYHQAKRRFTDASVISVITEDNNVITTGIEVIYLSVFLNCENMYKLVLCVNLKITK